MDVSKHLERAEKEAAKKNYDGAVLVYDQIIALDPDCGPARLGKRRASLKKFAKDYPSAGALAIKTLGAKIGVGLGRVLRLNGLVARCAESALTHDPKNVGMNLALGQALLRLGHKSGAEAAFAIVAEFDDRDVESLKTLGRLYYETKKWEDSLRCFERVLELAPRDQEATKMRKNLAAEGAIKTGGFEGAGSTRDLAKSKEQMDELEKRQRMVTSSDEIEHSIKKLQDDLKAKPDDFDGWIKLGTLAQQNRDLKTAVSALERAKGLRPDDFETSTRYGDAKLADLDHRIREAKEAAAKGDEDADDLLRRLTRERRSFRVDEFQRRVKAQPTDLGLRYLFGQCLLEDGQIDEAIAEFQLAVKDPKKKFQSMTLLGQAFLKKGMGDLAIKQLSGALEGAGGISDRTKEIAYSLATAYEQSGAPKDALETFVKIYEIDISYRDVGKKIEGLRQKSG